MRKVAQFEHVEVTECFPWLIARPEEIR